MTVLSQRAKTRNSVGGILRDALLETGGIAVDQDAYSTDPDSTVLDRVYDVKGFSNWVSEIENTGGVNGLTYTIIATSKEFTTIADLAEADFDNEILADTNVAFGAKNVQEIIDISPQTTAVRIKIKRQTSGQDTTLGGLVSVN